MRQAVVQQLALLNYRVLESASAPAALEMLANERIDLVFSDVVMPGGMDGFDLAKRVGGQWPAVRVLMTSGSCPAQGERGLSGRSLRRTSSASHMIWSN